MPRSRLNTVLVVDTAARLADAEGLENLTLKRLADELDIRSPSLFSHIQGLADLRRQLQLRLDQGLQKRINALYDTWRRASRRRRRTASRRKRSRA